MSSLSDHTLASEQTSFSWFAVLLPALLSNGFLVLFLYGPFLHDQSAEIARAIQLAEIDLNGYIAGRASELGAFTDLLPKFGLFALLLIAWLLVSGAWVLQMAPKATPTAIRFVIAMIVPLVLPLIFLIKYWTSWHPALAGIATAGFPSFTLAVIAMSLLVLTALGLRHRATRGLRSGGKGAFHILFFVSVALYAAIALAFLYGGAHLALAMGTVNIVMMFLLLLFLILCGVTLFCYERTGAWAIVLFIAYLAVLGAFKQFREVPQNGLSDATAGTAQNVGGQRPQAVAAGAGQFERWLGARQSASEKPFPVFIVAASGGGLRAAMRTAYFLEHLRLHCPAATRHILAISAVSGGAFGALIHAAHMKFLQEQGALLPSSQPAPHCRLGLEERLMVEEKEQQKREQKADSPLLDTFFQTEIIPSIVGAGLFSDLFQRMVPPRLLPAIDRSKAFKEAFADSWRNAVDTVRKQAEPVNRGGDAGMCSARDFLDCASDRYWSSDAALPLLVFNATSATNGRPIILSNIDADLLEGLNFVEPPLLPKLGESVLADAQSSGANFRFSLISGASASAGFPIALPATVFEDVGGRRHMLVDGGYFDNSGLATALTIRQNIAARLSQQTAGAVRIVLIYLHATQLEKQLCENIRAIGSASAPIGRDPDLAHAGALFHARDSRSEYTLKLIKELEASGTELLQFNWEIHEPPLVEEGELRNDCAPYAPLAFYFSPTTFKSYREKIHDQMLLSQNNRHFFQVLENIMTSISR